MSWVSPSNSKEQIDTAGDVLIDGDPDSAEFEHAFYILDNWRASHGYPLNTFTNALRRKAEAIGAEALIAQRLKRAVSIVNKLDRLRRLKLSVLQDIGGCRAVVKEVGQVRELRDRYVSAPHGHTLTKEDDYLKKPKPSGYRGIHLIYGFKSERSAKVYNGLQIEIQMRSQLQHAWATALETVDTFSRQKLKSGQGDKRWLRLFALMGSVIALKEGEPAVPGTPDTVTGLATELKTIASELDAIDRLETYGHALKITERRVKAGKFFVMVLNPATKELKIGSYAASEASLARTAYADIERKNIRRPDTDAVLVSVDSIRSLRDAFPNYYLDTQRFVELLSSAVG